jgi:hypothetical protein
MWEIRTAYTNLIRKFEKRPFGRPWSRRKDNIKIELKVVSMENLTLSG